MNIFHCHWDRANISLPHPSPLDEEQRENLQMLVPIAEWESVPEATVHTLRELGAFRLQVRLSLNVFPICKTVNILCFRFPMRWTVQCGPYQHPVRQAYRVHWREGSWCGNFHRSSPIHRLQPHGRLRSRLHDCGTEAQKHKDTRKAPAGDVLYCRNEFLYISESGLSDLACDTLAALAVSGSPERLFSSAGSLSSDQVQYKEKFYNIFWTLVIYF